jgi:alkanesulfonate monooxygenase SsuD/methylene tetrahydromethanopterin reductase-like flavin-dependent oxidoreductase (luciferase family)
LRETGVSWSGRYRPPLTDATTQPRPYRPDGIPLWHGSASSTESTELAARWGDPLFSANGFHPLEKYAALIRHYRERWEAYGRDPAAAVVGARHNQLPFRTLEEFLEGGSVLAGSPEQVIDKFGRYQETFRHELSGMSLEVPGLPAAENRESVETFVTEVLPVLRSSYPSRVWADGASGSSRTSVPGASPPGSPPSPPGGRTGRGR